MFSGESEAAATKQRKQLHPTPPVVEINGLLYSNVNEKDYKQTLNFFEFVYSLKGAEHLFLLPFAIITSNHYLTQVKH